ncbi:MAG: YdeI/OmpD-associated family protein [Saprospiraceae bacterium]|nr:YdeI/OmpD-associated family protein [Saprospiraceae bacterium]
MNADVATIFFDSPLAFRRWLEEHHQTEQVLWVGYYKKHTGTPSLTWPESVDQALCFGWIDGLRHTVDEKRYRIRFTPRKPTSNWSDVNVKRYGELLKEQQIHPAGKAAFAKKKREKSGVYSFEQDLKKLSLSPEYEAIIKKEKAAWAFFQKLPPSVRKPSIWWVVSAKQEATRERRLAELIRCSAEGKKIKMLRRKGE